MASADELTERGRGGDHVGNRAGRRGCAPDRHLLGPVQRHPARPSVHWFLREDEGRAARALALGGDSGLTAAVVSRLAHRADGGWAKRGGAEPAREGSSRT